MADGALLPGLLLWSLPAMFLLHDAEEVLLLPPWLRRNREWLARRFPQLARRTDSKYFNNEISVE